MDQPQGKGRAPKGQESASSFDSVNVKILQLCLLDIYNYTPEFILALETQLGEEKSQETYFPIAKKHNSRIGMYETR